MAHNPGNRPFYAGNWFTSEEKHHHRGGTAPHFEMKAPGQFSVSKTLLDNLKRGQGHKKENQISGMRDPDSRSPSNSPRGENHQADGSVINKGRNKPMSRYDHERVSSEAGGELSQLVKKPNKFADIDHSLLLESFVNEELPKKTRENHTTSMANAMPTVKDKFRETLQEGFSRHVDRPNSSYSMLRSQKATKRVNVGRLFDDGGEGHRLMTLQHDDPTDLEAENYSQLTKGSHAFRRDRMNTTLAWQGPNTQRVATSSFRRAIDATARPQSRQKTPSRALGLELPKTTRNQPFVPLKNAFMEETSNTNRGVGLTNDSRMGEDFDILENNSSFLREKIGLQSQAGTAVAFRGAPVLQGRRVTTKPVAQVGFQAVPRNTTAEGRRMVKVRHEDISISENKKVVSANKHSQIQQRDWKVEDLDEILPVKNVIGPKNLHKEGTPRSKALENLIGVQKFAKMNATTDNYFKRPAPGIHSSLEPDFLGLFAN